jgi:hypothetical protein
MRPLDSSGAGAFAALALLDGVNASPESRCLASAPAALGTRPIVLSPRVAMLGHFATILPQTASDDPNTPLLKTLFIFRYVYSNSVISAEAALDPRQILPMLIETLYHTSYRDPSINSAFLSGSHPRNPSGFTPPAGSIAFCCRLLIQPTEKRNLCKLLVFPFRLEVESALKDPKKFSTVCIRRVYQRSYRGGRRQHRSGLRRIAR